MTLYSVYARNADAPTAVPDRFSWFAALLPPVYALVHGLWLLLLGWVLALLLFGAFALWGGDAAAFWLYVIGATLLAFEAPALRRGKLVSTGWSHRTDLIAADADLALVEYLKQQR